MHVRLTYFDFPFWRAEMSRLALHIGGVDFDDNRLTREQFGAKKAAGDFPYGQVPVLEIDGVMIAQSAAIARICGQLSGLYPADDLIAEARMDEILAASNQISDSIRPSVWEKDPDRKAAMRAELAAETLPRWFGWLEQRLTANGSTGFVAGDRLTVADLGLWRLLDWITSGMLDGIPTTLLEPHPQLNALYQTVNSRADVRQWMSDHYPSR